MDAEEEAAVREAEMVEVAAQAAEMGRAEPLSPDAATQLAFEFARPYQRQNSVHAVDRGADPPNIIGFVETLKTELCKGGAIRN